VSREPSNCTEREKTKGSAEAEEKEKRKVGGAHKSSLAKKNEGKSHSRPVGAHSNFLEAWLRAQHGIQEMEWFHSGERGSERQMEKKVRRYYTGTK